MKLNYAPNYQFQGISCLNIKFIKPKQKMNQNNNPSPAHLINNGRFSFSADHLLGRGATGNVYQGMDHKQNKPIAVKVIETAKMNQVQKNLIENQKKALKMIKHDNIMKLYHIEDQNNFTYIISELYEGGSLKQYLEQKGKLLEQQALQFFRKIVLGYCAIVEANVIHRDLKPSNILLTKSNEPIIIDFGYSQIIIANKNLTVFNVGSPSYMSPQAYSKTIYSEKSDVWSLGAIFYQLLMNTTLDENIPTKQYFQSLSQAQHPSINFSLFGDVSKQILKGTLAVKPQQRITSHRIKYLLDKQILGKKFCQKVTIKTDQCQGKIARPNYKDCKSMRNFEFLVKQIDFSKLKQEEDLKNMKKKPKTFTSFPTNPNQITSSNKVLLTPTEFIQEMIKAEANKKVVENQKQSQVSKKYQAGSLNITPSISRIDFKQYQSNKNATSTINYIQRKQFQNKNVASHLIMGSRETSKNMSTLQISNLPIKNLTNNNKHFSDPYPTQNSVMSYNNEYFNDSRRDIKNLTYNEGFYNRQQLPQNNINLGSSYQQNPIRNENKDKLICSNEIDRIKSYRNEIYRNSKQQQSILRPNMINDLSNRIENKKSSKRLSVNNDVAKQKSYLNQCQTYDFNNYQSNNYQSNNYQSNNYQSNNYQSNNYQSNKLNHKIYSNQNIKSQLLFKTQNINNFMQMKQLQSRNNTNNKNKNIQTPTIYSQNNLNFRQIGQSYQTPKSYQDLNYKHYQSQQNNTYQKSFYPPKPPTNSNQTCYISQHTNVYNTNNNFYNQNNQSSLQFQQGNCQMRKSTQQNSKKVISLRKII